MLELTDYDLVQNCLRGKQDSFTELVSRYKKLIYNVVYKFIKDGEETSDISQEVFLKIYKALDSYNPQYRFSTWSIRIATNYCLDILRKKKVNSIPIEEIEAVSRDVDTPEKMYISKERTLEIRQAISRLPEKYRIPIILYHQRGASYKEMSEILNKPMSIVKNRLYRARLMLREDLLCMEGK